MLELQPRIFSVLAAACWLADSRRITPAASALTGAIALTGSVVIPSKSARSLVDRTWPCGGSIWPKVRDTSIGGRICLKRRKINLSQVFAGQTVGIKQVDDRLWLASFMHYDLGYFDDETCRLEPLANRFGAKVLPMTPE